MAPWFHSGAFRSSNYPLCETARCSRPTAAAAPADTPDDLGDMRLLGIVRSDTQGDLAIVGRDGSPATRLRPGDVLRGWRLMEVGAREIVLEGDNRARRVLRLARSAPLMAPQPGPAPIDAAPLPR